MRIGNRSNKHATWCVWHLVLQVTGLIASLEYERRQMASAEQALRDKQRQVAVLVAEVEKLHGKQVWDMS